MTDDRLLDPARPSPTGEVTRQSLPDRSRRAAAMAILLVIAAACSPSVVPTGSPGASAGPTAPPGSPTAPAPTPTSVPTTGDIAHPTGPGDVLLRMEVTGGLMPVESMATHAPSFTLYGDGTVIWRDPTIAPPDPIGNIIREVPFLVYRLDEAGIQAMLADAIGPGGLGIATGPYLGLGADIPTTTFTITANGQTKSVSVSGLMPDVHPNDAAIVAALGRLAERLQGLAGAVGGEQIYVAPAYRGVLMATEQAFGPVIDWPWKDIKPSDFVAGENTFFLTRTLTPAELAEMEMPPAEGGMMGVTLKFEGKLFTFALRPLLPDETR